MSAEAGRRFAQVATFVDRHLAAGRRRPVPSRWTPSGEPAFRECVSTSPAAYLHEYRLARIYEELLDAVPGDGTTVTRVAALLRA